MSTYLENSEISRLNDAPAADPFAVSPGFLEVVVEAQRLSDLTGGAFDVTVGPLVNAYGFGPQGAREVPSQTELDTLRANTGYQLLTIDPAASTVAKERDGVYVDLSALAKGFAVDRVADVLTRSEIDDFMVEVGGEVRTAGRNLESELWRIGIERPDFVIEPTERPLQRIASIDGMAMATSGDYRNFREVGGKRLTHIFDPRSGTSVHHRLASVTVLHKRCVTADGLATALMVLGPDEALAFANQHEIAALLLLRGDSNDGGELLEERTSSAWTSLLGS